MKNPAIAVKNPRDFGDFSPRFRGFFPAILGLENAKMCLPFRSSGCDDDVSIPEFSAKIRKLSANVENFPQTLLRSLECSYSSPVRRCVRRTEAYPILKTFLRFFKLRSLCGVGAPEGLENVPDILTQKFPQSKCVWLFIMALQYQNFPQDQSFPQNVPKNSAKYSKSGQLTCDFLAVVEG